MIILLSSTTVNSVVYSTKMKAKEVFLLGSLLCSACVSARDDAKMEWTAPAGISLQYPLVLVHGIILRDNGRFVHAWGRIPDILQEKGVRIFFGNTDAWGDIESNAHILKTTIDSILEETGSERVNIIAHSKGGIDARYFIWYYDYGDRVASLTTISTPHHGSEIADLLFHSRGMHSRAGRRILAELERLSGDIHPDIYSVNYELTTEKMEEFNNTVVMDDRSDRCRHQV